MRAVSAAILVASIVVSASALAKVGDDTGYTEGCDLCAPAEKSSHTKRSAFEINTTNYTNR